MLESLAGEDDDALSAAESVASAMLEGVENKKKKKKKKEVAEQEQLLEEPSQQDAVLGEKKKKKKGLTSADVLLVTLTDEDAAEIDGPIKRKKNKFAPGDEQALGDFLEPSAVQGDGLAQGDSISTKHKMN